MWDGASRAKIWAGVGGLAELEKVFNVFGRRLSSKGTVRQNVAPRECSKLIS